jgi:hypothetical protein
MSTNWSGYVVPQSNGSQITEAGGKWAVPKLDCTATPTGGAGVWVGTGGFVWPGGVSSGALLQTGVTTDCVNGAQQSFGWFELYPSNPNRAYSFSGFSVSPGDSIQATVFQTATGAWETRVDDLTTSLSGVMVTGQGYGVLVDSGNGSFPLQGSTANLSYSGGTSAEWILEAYSQGGSTVSLAAYGTVSFSNLTTSLPSWSLAAGQPVALVQNGNVVSTPSPAGGSGFTLSYTG